MKAAYFTMLISMLLFAACVTENIQDGDTAFRLKKYDLATSLLQKDFNKEERPAEKAKIAFEIAESYQYINHIAEAATWYKTAIDWDYGSDAILNYARMLKAQEKYTEAIQQYRKYLEEEPYRRPEISAEITSCDLALQWMERQKDEYERDTYVSAVDILNSPQADFDLVPYRDNIYLFTSSRQSANGENSDKWTGDKYYDVFQTTMSSTASFTSPELFTGSVNTNFNDGAAAFSRDGTEMLFTRCGSTNKKADDYCNLYYSYFQPDAGWSEPEILPFFEDSLNVGTACFSPDGQSIYFAAVHQDGYGGSDIYMSRRLSEGGWDSPVNAGQTINTAGNEVFPSFGADGTFYFSSDGLPGMGGLDIFSAKLTKGKFSKIENLEYPVNSGGDDFGMLMTDRSKIKDSDTLELGYFSSSRTGGKGEDDIYMFVKTTKKLRPPVYVLHARVMEKVYADTSDVNSAVIDTTEAFNSIGTIAYPDQLTLLGRYQLKEDVNFSMQIDSVRQYKISGSKDGYFTRSVVISTEGIQGKPGDTTEVFAEVVLDKVPGKKTAIKLNNIYYDFNDTTLRTESFPELDKLVALLNENPALTIQINSHTDARGTDKYNNKLSQGRANSVVAYLIAKGIDARRLVARGFGETTPEVLTDQVALPDGTVVPKGTQLNETFINSWKKKKENFEFLHQINRRTTFNVLSADFHLNSGAPEEIKVDQAPDNK